MENKIMTSKPALTPAQEAIRRSNYVPKPQFRNYTPSVVRTHNDTRCDPLHDVCPPCEALDMFGNVRCDQLGTQVFGEVQQPYPRLGVSKIQMLADAPQFDTLPFQIVEPNSFAGAFAENYTIHPVQGSTRISLMRRPGNLKAAPLHDAISRKDCKAAGMMASSVYKGASYGSSSSHDDLCMTHHQSGPTECSANMCLANLMGSGQAGTGSTPHFVTSLTHACIDGAGTGQRAVGFQKGTYAARLGCDNPLIAGTQIDAVKPPYLYSTGMWIRSARQPDSGTVQRDESA